MTDNFSEEEFAPIAAAMKRLPYFEPSPRFADKVMARVRIQGSARVSAAAEIRAITPTYSAPLSRQTPVYPARFDSRSPARSPQTDLRRSIPARIAGTALVASLGVTLTVVALVAFFDLNLFLLVTRLFGENAIAFLAGVAADGAASAVGTAAATGAAAGTGAGVAVIGSFAAGVVAATAALRAAASASRRAA